MNSILPFPVGQNLPALGIATLPEPAPSRRVPPRATGPSLQSVHSEVLHRLAEAERTGRATLDPAQTALVLEIASATFRMGCEVG